MKTQSAFATTVLALATAAPLATAADEPKSINALFLTGGGYHDYNKQTTILTEGIGKRINVKWSIIHKDAAGVKDILSGIGWADGFDLVVYNLCHAHETDAAYVSGIAATHAAGIPAVVIHCTLHSYHWKTGDDAWVRFLGVTSPRHGEQAPITVRSAAPQHPIMRGMPCEWVTPQEELYEVVKTWDTATVLATGTIDGGKSTHPVVWTNQHGKARVFGTSIGHHDSTMEVPLYLDLLSRGVLWASGHLADDGKPDPDYLPNSR